MRHAIVFAPEAHRDLKRLDAHDRSKVRSAIEIHLRHEPGKTSRSRIKRLRGLSRPQYRLRVGEVRIFYDVMDNPVEILSILTKATAGSWISEIGEKP